MRTALVLALTLCAAGALAAPAAADSPYWSEAVYAHLPATMPVKSAGAAVSPDGSILYAVDSPGHVLEYSAASLTYLGGWGSHGSLPGEFDNPRGITVDPYGDIYVADSGNNRVEKFTSTGKFLLSFNTPDPVGVAASGSVLCVLSGIFKAVAVRSFSGKDLGGFVANFPDPIPYSGYYGAQSNTAEAIATDPAGHAVVTGTLTQPLVGTQVCSSPVSKLDQLPDPLVAPAVATFDQKGNFLHEEVTHSPGVPCWDQNPPDWAFQLSGYTSGDGAAVDPASGVAYDIVIPHNAFALDQVSEPTYVYSSEGDPVSIWNPYLGPVLAAGQGSWVGYGPIRAFAIGCDSAMYLVLDTEILRYPSALSDPSHCGTRSRFATASPTVVPALGGVPAQRHGPPSKPGKLSFATACPGQVACSGTVVIELRACPVCQLIATVKTRVKLPAGTQKVVSVKLPGGVSRRLASGHPVFAVAKVGHTTTAFPVREPTSLTAGCSGAGGVTAASQSFTVTGVVKPARRGIRVQIVVTEPNGQLMTLKALTGRGGRYTVRVLAAGDGVWAVAAALPGSRTLAPAQAGCDTVIGQLLLPPSTVARPESHIESLDMTLSCPDSAVAGQSVPVSGTLTSGDGGVPVGLTITSPSGATSSSGATTGGGGGFSAQFTPDAAGNWTVLAQATDASTTLSRSCTVAVSKRTTSLTLDCPMGAIPLPSQHDFTGNLTRAVPGATVTVTLTPPAASGKSPKSATGTVDAAGNYKATFNFVIADNGQWSAQASWPGDGANAAASSSTCNVMLG